MQADFQRLSGVNLGGDLLTRLHAVEEGARRQGAHRAIHPVTTHVVEEHLGIHQIAVQIFVIDGKAVQIGRNLGAHRLKVHGWDTRAGTGGQRRFALENLGLNALWPAAVGLAEIALEHVDH